MKKIKMFLDIIMMVIMILLMKLDITGITIHEILGLGIFVLFLIHKGLNFKWIKAITMRLTDKNMSMRTKIMYFLDVFLVIFVTLNVISGVLISRSLFPWIAINNGELMTRLHYLFAYGSLILIMVHVIFHWNMILSMMKIKNHRFFGKIVLTVISIVILAFSIRMSNVKRIFVSTDTKYLGIENESKDQNDGSSISSGGNDVNTPSLEEYLSKLFCTGCGKHCPLTSPQCGKGVRQGNDKVQQYNSTYGTNLTYDFSK